MEWLPWVVISWRLSCWNGTGVELRQREIAATQAWRLLSTWVVVSLIAISLIESEDTNFRLLSWVGGLLVQLLDSKVLVETVCLGDGLLYPGCLLDLAYLWGEKSVSRLGVGRMWLTLKGLKDFTDWRYKMEWTSRSALVSFVGWLLGFSQTLVIWGVGREETVVERRT